MCVRLTISQAGRPVDFNNIPFGVIKIESQRYTVIQLKLDRETAVNDILVEGSQF